MNHEIHEILAGQVASEIDTMEGINLPFLHIVHELIRQPLDFYQM